MATYVVTTLDDELDSGATDAAPGGTGLSLREAIALANANGGPDTITFASNLSGGTITIDPGKSSLNVAGELTIIGDLDGDGAPDITLDGGNAVQIMTAIQALTIDGLTMTRGYAANLGSGGAIRTSAPVTVLNSVFTANTSTYGGAINSSADITITNSVFTGNAAQTGGAVMGLSSSIITVETSTFDGNRADFYGGAIFSLANGGVVIDVTSSTFSNNGASTQHGTGGAISALGNTTATNTTFYGNTAYIAGAVYSTHSNIDLNDVTAVANTSSSLMGVFASGEGHAAGISGSILIGNSSPTLVDALFLGTTLLDAGSPFASDPNVILATSVADVFVVDGTGMPVLANNGGPVKTVALNPDLNNPALDAGGLSTDARGESANDISGLGTAAGDLGAYEYVGAMVTGVGTTTANGIYWIGQSIDISVTFDSAVTVSGSPTLLLETGTTDRTAAYIGGSGTTTLTFRYTVQAGDTAADLDLHASPALALSGGTISSLLHGSGAIRNTPASGSPNSLAAQADIEIRGVHAPAAPVLATMIADQTAAEDQAFRFTVPAGSFTDINGDALTYTATLADGTALPSWLNFNAATRTFSGTPDNDNVGTISIKVTASDGISGSASDIFALTVTNTNDAPSEITLSARTIAENSAAGTVIGDLAAIDPDLGDTVTFSLVGTAGGRFALVGNQLIVAEGAKLDFETRQSHTITIRATDAAGATLDRTFTIGVTDIDDTLIGNRRANKLTGTDLDELLDGRAGNDRLTGNGGADTFVFGKGYGRDTITDFDPSEGDVIDLSGAMGIRNFRDLMRNHVDDTGKDLVITADDGSVLVLRGVDADDLGRDSLLF